MIVTLTGDNHFLIQSELNQVVKSFVSKYGDMALEKYDGEESEYDQMREALESMPFLAPRKLVVLRSPSACKEFADKSE